MMESGPVYQIYAGENEGNPLLVKLLSPPLLSPPGAQGFADAARPWAVLVEYPLIRVDGNGLPLQEDWAGLERMEAALVGEFDDWVLVARIYGEGTAKFAFYARKKSNAEARLRRAVEPLGLESEPGITIQHDPAWAAYGRFLGEMQGDAGDRKVPQQGGTGFAPSFRDEPLLSRASGGRRGDEQPYREETPQAHPQD